MRDTPRTESNLRGSDIRPTHPFVEFTRQLERELAAKSAELARVRGLLDDYFAAYPHGKLGDAYRELKNAAAERLTRG